MSFFSSSYFSNCQEDICNYIIYDKNSGNLYFYDNNGYNNFVRFDYGLLEKDFDEKSNVKFYFNNINVESKVVMVDKDWTIFGDNLFYSLKIPYNGDIYEVLLSKSQQERIKLYEE
jgi:hypothetical protein